MDLIITLEVENIAFHTKCRIMGIEKLLLLEEIEERLLVRQKGLDCFCSVYKPLWGYIRVHFIFVNDWAAL